MPARRIKGYRADEILGHHFAQFYESEAVLAGKPDSELRQRRQQAGSRTKAGGFAKTAPASGPTSSSPSCGTTTETPGVT